MTSANLHPLYILSKPRWNMMRDAYEGEETIKLKKFVYLKPTASMVLDGALSANAFNLNNAGAAAYGAYLDRAIFPDHVEIGVETIVGILNGKKAVVNVPKGMEPILERFTSSGEDFFTALRKLHTEQLISGRAGLLVDMPVRMHPKHRFPYVAMYIAEDILNWDKGETIEDVDKTNLVVLNEHLQTRNGLDLLWKEEEKQRVLVLQSLYPEQDQGSDPTVVYKYAVVNDGTTPNENDLKTPVFDGKTLDEIPFVFVNTRDLLTDPDKPPLLGLARKCFAIYRAEADYRQTLYMQSQETLVIVGGVQNMSADPIPGVPADSIRTGAGARIDVVIGGDAKYIGVQAKGLAEQRAALEADHKAAAVRTGQLLSPGKASLESGEALKTRVAAQSATLTSIAITSASAMEKCLRYIARWMGFDDKEVSVTPNLDFVTSSIDGQDLVQLATARNLGYPLSARSMHDLAVERNLTRLTYEEELKEIEKTPDFLITKSEPDSLTGNNPVQSAGGPKSLPNDQTGKGNQPAK